ncbi:shikimate kinase [Haoranjiania flava]|uniref:Shikimate kinase n=1 Tax=Haoranjiania flava TaxID=1856322 RepID=A0AAE3IPP8_9BACT|nr:shikimate kinase [Haoranjiania flava]MCU7695045.1 shikimate kinase [Haoranjiania flava]
MSKIFLVGMMGSGKTTCAKKWAGAVNANAYDLDALIEEEEGCTISGIFAQKGEDYFRKKESELLRTFAQKDNFILATGGGAPCYYDNMQWMNEHGTTIWLNVSSGVLFSRLKHAREHRPLLRSLDDDALKEFINKKMAEREAFYSQAQHIFTDKEITKKHFKKLFDNDDK